MHRRFRSALLVTALALGATVASVAFQRVGPTRPVEGEGFCEGMDPCRIPVLAGGFPLPWLVDNPQVSVANSLSPPDDFFYRVNFAIDFAFWLWAVSIARRLWRRYRS